MLCSVFCSCLQFERLHSQLIEKQRRLDEAIEREAEVDWKTGRKLFHPEIGALLWGSFLWWFLKSQQVQRGWCCRTLTSHPTWSVHGITAEWYRRVPKFYPHCDLSVREKV